MITVALQFDGEEFFVEIPEEEIVRLGLHEGDHVSIVVHAVDQDDVEKR